MVCQRFEVTRPLADGAMDGLLRRDFKHPKGLTCTSDNNAHGATAPRFRPPLEFAMSTEADQEINEDISLRARLFLGAARC